MEDPSEICSDCNGSGWLNTPGSLQARPCHCQNELRRKQRTIAAAIPKRYYHCRLSNFNSLGKTSLASAKKKVDEFITEWPIARMGLLLMGPCGVGKTHLAVSLLHEIIEQEKPGKLLFSNFQDLIQEIHESFSSDNSLSKAQILRPLIECDLLVLDELGSQKPTAFVQDMLYYIINSRYNEERTTIFTTNYVDEPKRESDEKLEHRIGTRLRSRLFEMTERVVILDADDYRKKVTSRGI